MALPKEGIYFYPHSLKLADTEENIAAVLPQLTQGQHQSIHKIVLTDVAKGSSTSLRLSAEAFLMLNTHGTFESYNSYVGFESITKNDGVTSANISVQGSAQDLYKALSSTSGSINFVKQVAT